MFSKAEIRKVTIGVQKSLGDELIYELGKAELIHLSNASFEGVSSDLEMNKELKEEERRARGMINSIESLFSVLDIEKDSFDAPVSRITYSRDIDKDEPFIKSIVKKAEQFQRLNTRISRKIDLILEQIASQEELRSIGIDAEMLKGMKLCDYVFGSIDVDENEDISHVDDTSFIKQSGRHVFGITLPETKEEKIEYLKKYGFEDETEKLVSTELSRLPIDHLMTEVRILKGRLKRIEDFINSRKLQWEIKIKELYKAYREFEATIRAEEMFLFSRETVFISGWIDTRNNKRLVDILHKVCGESFLLIISTKREKDAPVILKNSRIFKPFELIVKNAGMPGNAEIDPTPIAAITYVLMFGVMFGDVGQGLVLAIAGLFMRFFSGVKEKGENFLSNAGIILFSCGCSAIIFGFFYGSFFSNEHLIPALWFHPMEDIMNLFFAVIMMGAVFNTAGIILNIINGLLIKNYDDAFFGSRGLAGLTIYAGSVFFFVRYIKIGTVPSIIEMIGFIFFPIFIFSMRNILGYFFLGNKNPFPHGAFEYFIETLVEIIEMLSSFLGNTISFIRAGAFALSHAGLSIAVYTLAGLVNSDLTSVTALSIIVIGNLSIILLEGLICGIQAMRLEYYEIFGKFFKGDGMGFAPFSLR
ncbi:MAG TPA: V-type ATPase 116kDa subunit family protein [Desulfobacteraceae bacterium]|nr:V-type ATPase 116kDa subunit family protein [Desulfobacteraceae bacterium]HPJ68726.1 V-type ATPase 116kDa subunit family protein [Desulfobacteraceae bacterium]HPQ28089.1 V-type ATPase 116kDa subunit family protein [Desulfobacteraceae bacterium]